MADRNIWMETVLVGAMILTTDYLTRQTWRFYRKDGRGAAESVRFLPNGKIEGHVNPNEASWTLKDGLLSLLNDKGVPTVHLDDILQVDGKVIYHGVHLPQPHIVLCLELANRMRQRLGTKNHFAKDIKNSGWEIGDHTYGLPTFLTSPPYRAKVFIGKYTSLATDIVVALGNHRLDTVSSYPFGLLREYWPSCPRGIQDHVSKGDVRIGNDVWIGNGAFVGSGVTIGDGAAVGAKCVVTRDVPPYAIVAGSPARVIRYRFSEDIIAALLELAWWNWPDEVVDAYLPLMTSSDIETFIKTAKAQQIA